MEPPDVAPLSSPIDAWLDRLAARTPTPGGGAAAALAGAVGAAVGAMALRFSVGRKANTPDAEATLIDALHRLDAAAGVLRVLAEDDQAAYAAWRATKDLADAHPDKTAAAERSVAVPLATMAAGVRLLAAAADAMPHVNPWLRGDLLCCGDLATAAVRCGRHNVLANVNDSHAEAAAEADALLARAISLVSSLSG